MTLVFWKELIDHFRDRRSVLASLLLPILGPLLLLGIFRLVTQLEKDRPLNVPVVGAEYAPRLIRYLTTNGAHILPPPADPEAAVRRREADLVLIIDAKYAEQYASEKSAHVRLMLDGSRNDTRKSVQRLESLLFAHTQSLGALRLLARGVSPQLAAPINVEEIDLSTPEKLAANLLSVIPLFLMLAALVGGMNLAIDATAGERERGSLEPLLLNPISRRSLVLGKWLATSLASVIVTLFTLAGFVLTSRALPLEKIGMKVALGGHDALLIIAAVVPLAWFGAGLQLLIATFARSYKEAQTYLNVLNLVPMAPSMFMMLDAGKRANWMLPVPAMAQVGTVVDVLRGDAVPLWQLGVIAATSLCYTALCLLFLERLLSKERIIFGR
jgi:sodium transport system permease protein